MLEEIITKQNPTFKGSLSSALKGKLKEEIINMGCNAVDASHHDLDKLVGGNYIEANFMVHDINSEHSSQMVTVRLIEKDGKYVYDQKNPLCCIVYDQSY